MRITANKKLISSLIKKEWRTTRKVLIKVRQPVMDMAEHSGPEALKQMVPHLLQVQPMNDHLVRLWGEIGGKFSYDTEKKIGKAKKADGKLKEHEARMRAYASQRSLIKAKAILDTEAEAINRVIDEVIKTTTSDGLGIIESRKLLVKSLESELTKIENWQAQRIAMTEVGSANNTGSFMAAQENSAGVKKVWMFIPGLKTYRENHKDFEAMGPQDMDFSYAQGLQFPGDENGAAEEVINCYCTIGYDISENYTE